MTSSIMPFNAKKLKMLKNCRKLNVVPELNAESTLVNNYRINTAELRKEISVNFKEFGQSEFLTYADEEWSQILVYARNF